MFQSLALRGLFLFVIANLVKAEVIVDDDIEAVIIQGNPFFSFISYHNFLSLYEMLWISFHIIIRNISIAND